MSARSALMSGSPIADMIFPLDEEEEEDDDERDDFMSALKSFNASLGST